MPRKIYKLVNIKNPNEEIFLNSITYDSALEEAIYELGWHLNGEWDEPYNSMFRDASPAESSKIYQDEHMMSLHSQKINILE